MRAARDAALIMTSQGTVFDVSIDDRLGKRGGMQRDVRGITRQRSGSRDFLLRFGFVCRVIGRTIHSGANSAQ